LVDENHPVIVLDRRINLVGSDIGGQRQSRCARAADEPNKHAAWRIRILADRDS
jgi:hypothetical protein